MTKLALVPRTVATVNVKNSTAKNNVRYFYVFLTEKCSVGVISNHTAQHITLVPPITADEQIVLDVAKSVASRFRQFKIRLNGRTMIGPKKDISVIDIRPNRHLKALHVTLFDELEKQNINIGYTRYARDEYTPHITIKNYLPAISETKSILFDHIAVIHKYKNVKTVLAKCMLAESNEK